MQDQPETVQRTPLTLEALLPITKMLSVQPQWQHLIFSGQKTWELRHTSWQFTGKLALWSNSQVAGIVEMTGSRLVALKNMEGEWEPYDSSPEASGLFPFSEENLQKHCVPKTVLRDLARSWDRIYAWFFSNPVSFDSPMSVQIRKGCQKIQSMDEEAWRASWNRFHRGGVDPPKKVVETTASDSLAIFAMARKDAFQTLEGPCSVILRTYRPGANVSTVHVAFTIPGTAFVVGKFKLNNVVVIKDMKQIRRLHKDGYEHNLPDSARQLKQIADGATMYAWLIQDKELLHPPLTWKLETLPSLAMLVLLSMLTRVPFLHSPYSMYSTRNKFHLFRTAGTCPRSRLFPGKRFCKISTSADLCNVVFSCKPLGLFKPPRLRVRVHRICGMMDKASEAAAAYDAFKRIHAILFFGVLCALLHRPFICF